MLGVRADVQVLAVDRAIGHVLEEAAPQPVVVRLADRVVHRAPPDLVTRGRLANDELVEGRAAGVLAGPNHQGAVGRDRALRVPDGVLVELGGRKVAVRRLERRAARSKLRGGHGLLLTSAPRHSTGTTM
jgi:hypothetical protein